MAHNNLIQYTLDPEFKFFKWVEAPNVREAQKFKVRGYEGGGWGFDTPQGLSANCFYAVNHAVEVALTSLGRPFSWQKVTELDVNPSAGKLWNAYYDRRGLRFFSNQDNLNQRLVHTASAGKIVYHETGHAILDSIRPDLWNYTNFEVWAFHEAFGDLLALFCTLQNNAESPYGGAAGLSGDCGGLRPQQASATQPL